MAKPLFTNVSSVFIRGEGGWGGDRGPSGPQNVPPDRTPDHQVTYQTSPDQALIYRLSGDRNPLHSDPSFAAMGGFDRPILHGLCTYGFTGRALLHTLCGSDVNRFRHIEGRFASPVLPGDALTVAMWETGDGDAVFTTSVGDRAVIDQGLVRFDCSRRGSLAAAATRRARRPYRSSTGPSPAVRARPDPRMDGSSIGALSWSAHPTLGDGQHIAAGLEHAAGDVASIPPMPAT